MEKQNKVAVNLVQDFTDSEKRQARENIGIDMVPVPQVQSDWAQVDNTKVDFIKSKPNIPNKTSQLTNDSGFITAASIPTVNDGDLKFQLGTADATKVFSANQSGESTIVVPYRTYTVNGSTTLYRPGVPTIEDLQAIYSQPDWAQSDNTKVDFIKNKPTIPTVNDGTLTITQGATTLGTFTANQSGNSTIAIPAPPQVHVPVQYYDFANFVSWPITSNTSYSRYQYDYPSDLDKTKDYIVTFSINISQPTGETWSLNNADIPYHFNVDTTGSFSVFDATGFMTNLGGRSLYSSSLSVTVRITATYMSGENLNFLLYLPPNTLTTSNTVELGYKIYYQEDLS